MIKNITIIVLIVFLIFSLLFAFSERRNAEYMYYGGAIGLCSLEYKGDLAICEIKIRQMRALDAFGIFLEEIKNATQTPPRLKESP